MHGTNRPKNRWVPGVILLLLLAGCRCEGARLEPAGSDVEEVAAVETDANCGVDPEVRRARRRAQEAREAEEARVRALQVEAAERDAQGAAAIDALRKQNQACAEGLDSPDAACRAFVSGGASECSGSTDASAANCRIMASLGVALRAQDAGLCASLTDRGFRRICEGAITGEWRCPSGSADSMVEACSALASGSPDAACERPPAGGGACNVVRLIGAIRAKAPERCADVPGVGARRLCTAWFEGEEACRGRRGTGEPRCRGILLPAERLDAQGPRTWNLRYINLFTEDAVCVVHIHAMQGETGDERLIETVDLGVIPGGGALQEKPVSLAAEHSGEVRFSASCRWQSP